jgi:uncharacterized membrane protein YdjX (TVP38/TMEM64 family)
LASPPTPRALFVARIAAVAGVVLLLLVAHRLGVLERVAEPARLKQSLVGLGAWGYVAFLVAYALLQPFGVPGTVFVFAAPLIWPWPVAFALSMTGTMAASVIGFSFSRFVARDWVSRILPERFRRYDEALERRAFSTVVLMRFVFWMPQLLHAFFGVSKVRFWTHFWGSLIGYLVPLFLVSYFGERVFDALRAAPPSVLAALAGGTIAVVVTGWVVRLRCARAGGA